VSASARELRGLVPLELALVGVAAFVPLPVPVVIPLLVVASLSLWIRGLSWGLVIRGSALTAGVGAAVGVVALVLALAAGTPLVERLTDNAVQWSMYPIVRGSPSALAIVGILVALGAIAAELVLRGWLVERQLGLGRSPIVAIAIGAFAEALLVFPIGRTEAGALELGGDIITRLGAAIVGVALGWMYVAAGRSVLAPLCARLAFSLGALALEATRLVG
jgi:hypothetical protein